MYFCFCAVCRHGLHIRIPSSVSQSAPKAISDKSRRHVEHLRVSTPTHSLHIRFRPHLRMWALSLSSSHQRLHREHSSFVPSALCSTKQSLHHLPSLTFHSEPLYSFFAFLFPQPTHRQNEPNLFSTSAQSTASPRRCCNNNIGPCGGPLEKTCLSKGL